MKVLSTVLLLILSIGLCYAQIPTQNLEAHYSFDGNVNDQSGNAYHLTNNGAVLCDDRTGNPNSAYKFDGTNDYMVYPQNTNLEFQFPVTFTCWIKIDALNSYTTANLWASDDSLKGYTGMSVGIHPSGQIEAKYGNGNCYSSYCRQNAVSSVVLDTNQWYHLTVIFSAQNNIRIFVDCIEDTLLSYNGNSGISTIEYTANGGKIGGRFQNLVHTYYFNGRMDDMTIYSRALTDAEVKSFCGCVCTDTITVNDTITVYDTIQQTIYDTIQVYLIDTIYVVDTTFITVTDTLKVDLEQIIGVGQPPIITTISIYPNPASDVVIINTGSQFTQFGNYTLQVVNTSGQVLFNSYINQYQYTLNHTLFGSAGLYFVRVLDPTGNIIHNKKLIIY